MPLPAGAIVELPVTEDIDIYFTSDAGVIGDLRILELS
jgi:hypothetical protein